MPATLGGHVRATRFLPACPRKAVGMAPERPRSDREDFDMDVTQPKFDARRIAVRRWGLRRVRWFVAGAVFAGVAPPALAAPPQRAAILLPPQRVDPSELPL